MRKRAGRALIDRYLCQGRKSAAWSGGVQPEDLWYLAGLDATPKDTARAMNYAVYLSGVRRIR